MVGRVDEDRDGLAELEADLAGEEADAVAESAAGHPEVDLFARRFKRRVVVARAEEGRVGAQGDPGVDSTLALGARGKGFDANDLAREDMVGVLSCVAEGRGEPCAVPRGGDNGSLFGFERRMIRTKRLRGGGGRERSERED